MLILAMFATVILLVCMGFFMMGSLPLLVLKHDTPLDARFIRGLFNVYYVSVMITATIGAASFALAGRPDFALAFSLIGIMGVVSRHMFIARMDALRGTMTATNTLAIRRFRLLHIAGMLSNLVQLMALCVGMANVPL